jgi:putative endonuclease
MLSASKQSVTQQLGSAGEHAVGQWLQQQGFTVIAYNYRTKGGEIDVIATRDEVIAFIEVKVRSSHYFNSSEVVVFSKQKKIIRTARQFCMHHHIRDKVYRFDVALLKPLGNSFEITYLANAFTDTSRGSL